MQISQLNLIHNKNIILDHYYNIVTNVKVLNYSDIQVMKYYLITHLLIFI